MKIILTEIQKNPSYPKLDFFKNHPFLQNNADSLLRNINFFKGKYNLIVVEEKEDKTAPLKERNEGKTLIKFEKEGKKQKTKKIKKITKKNSLGKKNLTKKKKKLEIQTSESLSDSGTRNFKLFQQNYNVIFIHNC